MKSEKYSMQNKQNQRPSDIEYYSELENYWDQSIGSNLDKLKAFTKYVPFSEFPKFIVKYELFKKILNIHGAIIECGVHQGAGIMTWGLLSSIFEPVNHTRKVVGFDTFQGFIQLSEEDKSINELATVGGLSVDSYDDLRKAISFYDKFRPLGHINKIELIRGDACNTIPNYLKDNPHLIISLLFLDFDLFEPTKIALKSFLNLMPKGSIVAFDELYNKDWPGETSALLECKNIRDIKLERFQYYPHISYFIID